jgi:hypothetical protein
VLDLLGSIERGRKTKFYAMPSFLPFQMLRRLDWPKK